MQAKALPEKFTSCRLPIRAIGILADVLGEQLEGHAGHNPNEDEDSEDDGDLNEFGHPLEGMRDYPSSPPEENERESTT